MYGLHRNNIHKFIFFIQIHNKSLTVIFTPDASMASNKRRRKIYAQNYSDDNKAKETLALYTRTEFKNKFPL